MSSGIGSEAGWKKAGKAVCRREGEEKTNPMLHILSDAAMRKAQKPGLKFYRNIIYPIDYKPEFT